MRAGQPAEIECTLCDFECGTNDIGKALMVWHIATNHANEYRSATGEDPEPVAARQATRLEAFARSLAN